MYYYYYYSYCCYYYYYYDYYDYYCYYDYYDYYYHYYYYFFFIRSEKSAQRPIKRQQVHAGAKRIPIFLSGPGKSLGTSACRLICHNCGLWPMKRASLPSSASQRPDKSNQVAIAEHSGRW